MTLGNASCEKIRCSGYSAGGDHGVQEMHSGEGRTHRMATHVQGELSFLASLGSLEAGFTPNVASTYPLWDPTKSQSLTVHKLGGQFCQDTWQEKKGRGSDTFGVWFLRMPKTLCLTLERAFWIKLLKRVKSTPQRDRTLENLILI